MVSSTESEIEIKVKNAEGDPDTKATIIHQNSIDYEPKVSVIIPVYNTEEYLRECLDSVVNQTLKEIEIICVDDGSTDSSLEILKEYAQKDNRITIITQKNLHAGVARNAGLSVARGEYLSFLDSDDWFELNMLEEMYRKCKLEISEIVICTNYTYDNKTKKDISVVKLNSNIIASSPLLTSDFKKSLFTITNPNAWTKIFNRNFIKKNNIKFESTLSSNDITFVSLALAFSSQISIINKPFIHYRVNSSSNLTKNRGKNVKSFIIAIDKLEKALTRFNIKTELYEALLTRSIASLRWEFKFCDEIQKKEAKIFAKDILQVQFYNDIFKEVTTCLISVIIPVYNTETFLRDCLESVINQTIKDIEIICINDCSTDSSLEILEEYEKNDQRIILISLDENRRQGGARNKGLEIATGKYVAFLDSDDKFKPDTLENLYNRAEKYKLEMLNFSGINYNLLTNEYKQDNCQKNDYVKNFDRSYNNEEIKNFISKIPVSACRFFYNASFLKKNKIIFPEKILFEDTLFVYRALVFVNSFGVTNENLYIRTLHDNQTTANWDRYFVDYIKIVEMVCELFIKEYKKDNLHILLVEKFLRCCIYRFGKYDRNYQLFSIAQLHKTILKISKQIPLSDDIKTFIETHHPTTFYAENLKRWYKLVTKKDLNLENPQSFNEKLQWMKIYESTPIKTQLADKYLVRDWVKEKIGEEYLIPLLGVYDRSTEIDFEKLPNQFVIKCNHGCGYNVIVSDKTTFDKEAALKKIDNWMNDNYAFKVGCELHYRDIKPKIVIEQFLQEINESLYDYRFFCCNGKVEQVWLDVNSGTPQHKRKIYNRNWKELDIVVKWPRLETDVLKPQNLDEMIKLSEHLSKNFAFVRVDFYDVNNKIYFGEMTFTSMSGIGQFEPEIECLKLGRKIKLPKLAYNIDTGEYYKLPNYKLKYFMQNIFSIKNEPIRKKHKIVTVAGLKLKVKRKHVTGYSLLEKMFSVKNEPIRKQHKVITILGFKFKIKRKAYGEYSFIEKIFSVKNKESRDNKWYKVITIFGVKFKFKNKDLMLRKNLTMLNSKFEEQMFNASKQYSILKNQNNELVKLINQMKSNNEEIQTQNKILKDQNNKNRFTQKDAQNTIAAILKRIYPKPYLRNFVVDITHHCNLNCKGCDHFSPLAEPAFYDLEQYKKDIACLSKLTSGNIDRVGIMGGEPLLNPDVLEYLKTTRQYFPETKIRLVTNGILLSKQSEEFWLTLKELNIFIEYTKYDLKLDYDYIDSVIKKYGVPIDVYGYDQNIVKTSYKIPLDLKGNQDPILNFFKCSHANECITLKNGRIYTCTVAPNIEHFNKHFGYNIPLTERDGIDIYKAKSVEEILEFISKPIPFCKYCNVNGRTFGHKWEISKKDVNEWT